MLESGVSVVADVEALLQLAKLLFIPSNCVCWCLIDKLGCAGNKVLKNTPRGRYAAWRRDSRPSRRAYAPGFE